MPPMARGGGNLAGLLKVLALVVVVYFAATEGWPWLRDQLDRKPSPPAAAEDDVATSSGRGSRCVDRALEASTNWADQLRRFRQPPYDLDAWGAALGATDDRIATADAACACPLESCTAATAALGELRGLLSSVDSVVRGEPSAFRNPARDQERIDDLLGQARDLANDGR